MRKYIKYAYGRLDRKMRRFDYALYNIRRIADWRYSTMLCINGKVDDWPIVISYLRIVRTTRSVPIDTCYD